MRLLPILSYPAPFHGLTSSSSHCARSPFTVYVLTVKKGPASWNVFRRYREWEDLRMRLIQQLGSAPPMPPKTLFGRMRPEVIENRVLGLNHFLQLCLGTPLYASHRSLTDFLEKNTPPLGLDANLLDPSIHNGAAAIPEDAGVGAHSQQLKRLVNATAMAFISVSQEAPAVDPSYLAERSRYYVRASQQEEEEEK